MPETMALPAKKRAKNTINWPQVITRRSKGETYEQIAKALGCNPVSLKVGWHKKGLSTVVDQKEVEKLTSRASIRNRALAEVSDILRSQLANELTTIAGTMPQIPVEQTLSHLKARAEVLEPVARTAKTVFDWGESVTVGLVAMTFEGPDIGNANQVSIGANLNDTHVIEIESEPIAELADAQDDDPSSV